jgi:hypothetical protein
MRGVACSPPAGRANKRSASCPRESRSGSHNWKQCYPQVRSICLPLWPRVLVTRIYGVGPSSSIGSLVLHRLLSHISPVEFSLSFAMPCVCALSVLCCRTFCQVSQLQPTRRFRTEVHSLINLSNMNRCIARFAPLWMKLVNWAL